MKMRSFTFLSVMMLGLGAVACSSNGDAGEQAQKTETMDVIVIEEEVAAEVETEIPMAEGVSVAADVAEETWPEDAPDKFKVRFELSCGTVVAEFYKSWAPIGTQHFYELVKSGFFDDCRFFRVVPGFVVQVGMNGDPAIHAANQENIMDEPVKQSNTRGTITFAKTQMPLGFFFFFVGVLVLAKVMHFSRVLLCFTGSSIMFSWLAAWMAGSPLHADLDDNPGTTRKKRQSSKNPDLTNS